MDHFSCVFFREHKNRKECFSGWLACLAAVQPFDGSIDDCNTHIAHANLKPEQPAKREGFAFVLRTIRAYGARGLPSVGRVRRRVVAAPAEQDRRRIGRTTLLLSRSLPFRPIGSRAKESVGARGDGGPPRSQGRPAHDALCTWW